MGVADIGLGILAGVLSSLSPCVLPLLPIILTSAACKHWLGAPVLAAGVGVSFTAIALFVAIFGFAIGLDAHRFRFIAALLMIAIGVVLIVPTFHARLAAGAGPASQWVASRFGGFSVENLSGQFRLGLLLGGIWAPCVGPTLGAAALLASRAEDVHHVAAVMTGFGIGATLPLVLIGTISGRVSATLRTKLIFSGQWMRMALGLMLLVIGAGVATGLDKQLEAGLLSIMPEWLAYLSTRY